MWIAIKNTLLMMVVTLIGQVGIAMVLALMVDNIGRGKQFFKTVFFFPIVISATALGLLYNLIFLYDKGICEESRLKRHALREHRPRKVEYFQRSRNGEHATGTDHVM